MLSTTIVTKWITPRYFHDVNVGRIIPHFPLALMGKLKDNSTKFPRRTIINATTTIILYEARNFDPTDKRLQSSCEMDLFEEEELMDDTRAKLVHYEDEPVQLPVCKEDNARANIEMKENDDEYYAGKPVSRSQLGSTESEANSESGGL